VDTGSGSGGIIRLRELISEHTAEFTYDFRHRFNLSLSDIGTRITWREAAMLTSILLRDPSSWTQAARNEWQYPVSQEWVMARHTYDLIAQANFKKPKPFPTPWPDPDKQKLGSTKPQSREQVLAKLALMNPKETDG
jgi:hypothetical protein